MNRLLPFLLCTALGATLPALAADIGVTPVAVHLDRVNDRAAVSVVNSGAEPVIMQVEAIEWRRNGSVDEDHPTTDMVINPPVFTVQPGQSQLVRVGLRRGAQSLREGTYRIVLREVPAPARPGETRISGQVRVLMALRVPIYVAPANVVREFRWQATQAADGSITASLHNEGNVHVRVGRFQLRGADGALVDPGAPLASVVFPGESQQFRVRAAAPAGSRPATLEVMTDQGAHSVPVVLAGR